MPCFEQETVAMEEQKSSSTWTWEQDKAFEDALATDTEDSDEKWVKVVAAVPGKTVEEVKYHYQLLMEDLDAIESGLVPFPASVSSPEGSQELADDVSNGKKGGSGQGGRKSEQERRKGIAWTEDEHRLFLLGLEKYGKGDWRSISRHFVITRTPTQVASHAQKYFIRLNSMNKDRRRSSIHDITNVDEDISASQGPITGEINAPPTSSDKPGKPSQQTSSTSGVTVHGTPTIGQPVGGSLPAVVGTPVNMTHVVGAPVAGTVVQVAPVNPATYPTRHKTSKK